MATKLNPEVYRLAAELIHDGNWSRCCFAILHAACKLGYGDGQCNAHVDVFTRYFMHLAWKDKGFWNARNTPIRQRLRVMSLLMMAAIVEAGDA